MSDAVTHYWLSANAVLVVGQVLACQGALVGREPSLISSSVDSRVKEFTAGRTVARIGIALLAEVPCEIPEGRGGEPVWPTDLCGSISHTRYVATALLARRSTYVSVGVDVNDDRPIGDVASYDVVWPGEIQLVRAKGFVVDEPTAQNFIFSAKEAIFKCQYPVTGCRDLDFDQVHLVDSCLQSTLAVEAHRVSTEIKGVLQQISVVPLGPMSGHRIVGAFLPHKLV